MNSTMSRKVKLILGPMFASKSTYLLAEERRSKAAKKKIVCVKHSFDTRYTSGNEIATHNKEYSNSPSFAVHSLMSIVDQLKDYDVILIDEGQFFDDLLQGVEYLIDQGKYIIVAGLSSDYQKKLFKPIADLIPRADQIIHAKAICTCCGADAPFTSRIISEEGQTLVGGSESYEPRCRNCYT
jgi:thymidine kinase